MIEPINHISDTALWVAAYRADESERRDAIFSDPFARHLAGEKGAKIAGAIEFAGKNSWSFVARTYLFDECIKQEIALGADLVINLAAGLDTRPFRMKLPRKTLWLEVDLPGMIRYKQSMMAGAEPTCGFQRVALDLTDREARLAFFEQANAYGKKTLVICEGLMGYLCEEQAAELAIDLAAQSNFKRWALDLMSPALLGMAQKAMGDYLKNNTGLKFAPEQGEAFFSPYGWKPLSSKSFVKTAAALNRLTGDLLAFATVPEPEGPKGDFPWSGVCLLGRK